MSIKPLYCAAVCILLLSGCQPAIRQPEQPLTAGAIPPESQVNQLAALVAGGAYLRSQCQERLLPEREALLSQVVSLAQQRGWDTRHHAYQTLASKSETFYQGLLNDASPPSTQCEFFKTHIGPLVTHDS